MLSADDESFLIRLMALHHSRCVDVGVIFWVEFFTDFVRLSVEFVADFSIELDDDVVCISTKEEMDDEGDVDRNLRLSNVP